MTISATKQRFEFGRHATFAVRHGWLGKGLARIKDVENGFQADLDTADALGIGSRMVKSLQYWLEASGLAAYRREKNDAGEEIRRRQLLLTPLGEMLMKHDPYLEYPISWWFVHLFLARRDGSIWGWFFNDFRERSFDRAACVEAYVSHLRFNAANPPTLDIAQRDVACLLLSYASSSANERPDPEDGTVSPLRELALVLKHSDTGRYEKTRPLDRVPIEVFMACVGMMHADSGEETVSIGELTRRRHGPARVFGLSGDVIDELAAGAEREYRRFGVSLTLLGDERRLRIPPVPAETWLARHFERIG